MQIYIINKLTNEVRPIEIRVDFVGNSNLTRTIIAERLNPKDWIQVPTDLVGTPIQVVDDKVASYIPPLDDKTKTLYQAYNEYIKFCQDNGLPDVASVEDVTAKAQTLEEQAMVTVTSGDTVNGIAQLAEAIKLPLLLQGQLAKVQAAGGSWENIQKHDI